MEQTRRSRKAVRSGLVWDTNECSSCPPRQRHSITLHYCHTSKLCYGSGNKSSHITKLYPNFFSFPSFVHNHRNAIIILLLIINPASLFVVVFPPHRKKGPVRRAPLFTATDSKHFVQQSVFQITHLSGRSTRVHWRGRWWRWRSAGGSSWRLSSPASRGTPGVRRLWAAGCIRRGCAWAGRAADGCPGSGWEWSAQREEESVSGVKASSS